uniref:DNA helicase RecG n=1 Tax=Nannochloris bacillaris TaxID=76111 RepID=Q68BL2_NANBA|nr:DNA helicase RecG [Nannochloris bacillaris]
MALLRLQALSQRYAFMNVEERQWMLKDVIKAIELVENTDPTLNINTVAISKPAAAAVVVADKSPPAPINIPVSTTPPAPTKQPIPPPPKPQISATIPPKQVEIEPLTVWKMQHTTWLEQESTESFTPPSAATRWVPIVFDLETTGLSKEKDHPVEIAAEAPLSGRTFSTLIRLADGMSISTKAEEVTGITTAQCKDPSLPTFPQAYASFLRFIEAEMEDAAPGAFPLLVGHNIERFDLPLLLHCAKRFDVAAPLSARILDTLSASRSLLTGSAKPEAFNLTTLYGHLTRKEAIAAHRASADVKMTVAVLHALLEHSAGMSGPDGFAKFFNRRTLPPAFDIGWVGHLSLGSLSKTNFRGGHGMATMAAGKRKKATPFKSRTEFGALAVTSSTTTATATATATSVPASYIPYYSPVDAAREKEKDNIEKIETTTAVFLSDEDDFSVEAWSADDPLATIEAQTMRSRLSTFERQGTATLSTDFDELTEAHASWKALAMDPLLASTFLTQPLDKIKRITSARTGAPLKFTPTEVKNLQAAGMSRLIDLVESLPRGYTASTAGQLPDPTLPIEEEQAVSVAVRLEDIKVTMGRGSDWVNMNAILRVVGPEEAGLSSSNQNKNISGDSDDDVEDLLKRHSGRRTKLIYRQFRRGRHARYAISHEEAKLRQQSNESSNTGGGGGGGGGGIFAVAGRVTPAEKFGPDAWSLNSSSVEFITLDQLKVLMEAGEAHVRVSYPQKGKVLTSDKLAEAAEKALQMLEAGSNQWEDPVPEHIRHKYGFMGYLEALRGMHRPTGPEHYEACRRRLAFQELLVLQLKLLLQRATLRLPSNKNGIQGVAVTNFAQMDLVRRALPFELTGAQDRALSAVTDGMTGWPPMMALLQGDVGCGKTAVAFLSVLAATGSGYQAAVMAPTEILAEQHFSVLKRLIEEAKAVAEADPDDRDAAAAAASLPEVVLLTGSTKRAERNRIQAGLEDGSIGVIVGTHALISDNVAFSNLGLAIIDEQHKFGVGQRAALLAKASPSPHILSMSATPIPRSLALVAHGELSLVTIDELPPGRIPVATQVVIDHDPTERAQVYEAMRREVAAGGQVYIVCPLVDGKNAAGNSISGSSSMSSVDEDTQEHQYQQQREGTTGSTSGLKAAVHERDRLIAEGEIEASQCGVLHGRMSSEEKEAALAAFAAGKTPVLISTTVVEVGVDVPAASLIIVEHADRFGLAQLHQLRGRVGRGDRASACYLITDKAGEEAERLRVLERCSSGFDVAEADFAIRGAGEVIGRRQSGKEAMGGLKVCQLPQDGMLVEAAREAAAGLMAASEGRPTGWSRELLAAVVDPSLLDLDLAELPSIS